MNSYMNIIKNCPLFEGIQEAELTAMLNCLDARILSYSKNQAVFGEGDPANHVGIVLRGEVHIIKEDFYGNRSIIGRLEASQMFGETFACAAADTLPVSVIATCDAVIMLLSCRRIITTCSSSCTFHNRIIHNLLRVVADKNVMLNQKLEFVSKRTTKEKLMSFLLAQAKQAGSSTFTIPYDRQELADYLGVERSAMSAELGKLRREGKIEFSRSRFTVL